MTLKKPQILIFEKHFAFCFLLFLLFIFNVHIEMVTQLENHFEFYIFSNILQLYFLKLFILFKLFPSRQFFNIYYITVFVI